MQVGCRVVDRRRAVTVIAPWAWCAVALALSRWSRGVEALPCLGVLRGPLGVGLLVLAASLSLARFLEGRMPPLAPDPRALFALTFVLSAVVGLRYVDRLTASGDEPHYLLMAQSLWKEHDLDLRDNARREDYKEYFPGTLEPHWGAPRSDGRPFPAHSPGLPALLAPVYAAGGRAGCVLLFAVLASALVAQVHAMALRLTSDPRASLLAGALTAGPPAFAYSFHLYTELPSALAVAVALRILTGSPGTGAAAGAALAAAALPWLHLKMIPAAAALGVVAVARLRGRPLVAFLGVAALSATAFLAYYQGIFGVPTPLAVYGGGVPPDSAASPLRAAAGLLLDRSFGLLPYAPAFLLAIAGVSVLVGGERRGPWPHGLVGVAILVPLLRWRMWWGGQCPPARFLVPAVPLLAVFAGLRVSRSPAGLARWRWWLTGLGGALALFMAARPEALLMLNRGDRPTRVWAALSGATPVGRYLPSIVAASASDVRLTALWLGLVVLILALDVVARRRKEVDGLFRSLGFPLVLLLVAGVAADTWVYR
jgi:hypothetical protein